MAVCIRSWNLQYSLCFKKFSYLQYTVIPSRAMDTYMSPATKENIFIWINWKCFFSFVYFWSTGAKKFNITLPRNFHDKVYRIYDHITKIYFVNQITAVWVHVLQTNSILKWACQIRPESLVTIQLENDSRSNGWRHKRHRNNDFFKHLYFGDAIQQATLCIKWDCTHGIVVLWSYFQLLVDPGDLPIFIRVSSLALWQPYDWQSYSGVTVE